MTSKELQAKPPELAPLVRFSVYTHIQADAIRSLGGEIFCLLDGSVSEGKFVCDGSHMNLIYARFWLWVLGAYEITRTMSEYKECFSARYIVEIDRFKKSVSDIRVAFAKQQYRGREKTPIKNDASIAGFDVAKKDQMFLVNDKEVWMRPLIEQFECLIKEAKHEDILCDLRDAKPKDQKQTCDL